MPREPKKIVVRSKWRLWLAWTIVLAVCASTAVAALKVHDYAVTSPSFILSRENPNALTVEGLRFALRSKVLRVFAGDFGHSIFSAPLEERRRRLLAIDWIEDATISRIWPDRLLVRVRERTPVAFASFRSGVLMIDEHGVLLEPPPYSNFKFPVLSGIREDEDELHRAEAAGIFLRIQRELGKRASDISEVNAADPDDIHLVVKVDKRAAELLMGDTNFGTRYQKFLAHLPEILKKFPDAKMFDLRLDDRITVKE
jgi:cell division protein FtsQ